MKITRRSITASSKPITIPAPFDEYYEPMSDAEFERYTDVPARPSPCEEATGYDISFITYLQAKPAYADALADDGLDIVELIKEGGKVFPAYLIHDRIIPVSESELPESYDWDEDEDNSNEIESSISVEGAVDTGLEYWYYSRHGIGPGTIPQDVTVLDTVEEGWKTWMLLDKMLTTAELNFYDLKEEQPPEGSVTHNGDTIEGCDGVTASSCEKVSETDDTISYVVTSDQATEDIEAASLVNYKGYKILPDRHMFCWNVLDKDASLIETGFQNERAAKEFIDVNLSTEADGESITAAIDIDSIDLNALKSEIEEAIVEYFKSPQAGWSEDEAEQAAKDYSVVEVEKYDDNSIKIEVRAELSFDGMMDLAQSLDPIVEQYDEDAYFDMEDAGIMNAFLTNEVAASTEIEAAHRDFQSDRSAALDRYNERVIDRYDRYHGDPDDDGDEIIEPDPIDSEFDFNYLVSVDSEGDITHLDDDALYHADILDDEGVEESDMLRDFDELMEWYIPDTPGNYRVKGHIKMVYAPEWNSFNVQYDFSLDPKETAVTNVEVTNAGNRVESSVSVDNAVPVEAAMTEDELDQAILEGKPFSLQDFKKYKSPNIDEYIMPKDLKVGDIIVNDATADQMEWGTRYEVISINDPADTMFDYTVRVRLLTDPRIKGKKEGDLMTLYFYQDDPVGSYYED